ncbi:hypothetical protein QFZ94_002080 [Paraburkholderia sp. JPY465]
MQLSVASLHPFRLTVGGPAHGSLMWVNRARRNDAQRAIVMTHATQLDAVCPHIRDSSRTVPIPLTAA